MKPTGSTWEVEKFFAWWKKQLNVCHLIARSPYGVLVQIFAGLITYLLMAIYCAEQHGELVSMKRVRQLRTQKMGSSAESVGCVAQKGPS